MLRFVVPGKGEGMRIAIDGVGDSDHLVEIGWETGELGEIGLVHGAGGLAVMEVGAAGIVVERANCGDSGDAGGYAGTLCVCGGVAFEGGAVGIVGGGAWAAGCG